mgnify:CR=1 FL=1
MQYRALGNTGASVSRIGLGCGGFGGVGSAPAFFGMGESEAQARELMDAAWEMGITLFDTADAYGGGRSESAIGAWLRSKGSETRERIVLTTKVFHFEQSAFEFNLVAGLIRITILLVYLSAIALSKEIQRLFQFHGAEHKTVFAFELSDQLIPPAVRAHSRFHPRCGTSFLLIVMFVAIIAFGLLDAVTIALVGKMTILTRLLTHLPFIPVVGGISYEVIKFSAKHTNTWWGRILIAPGLWLQRVTTREPDESQLEVAIVALRCALGLEDPAKYTLRDSVPVESATVTSGN